MRASSVGTALDLMAALARPIGSGEFIALLLEQGCDIFDADRSSTLDISTAGLRAAYGWPDKPTSPLTDVIAARYDEHPLVQLLRRSANPCVRLRAHLTARQLDRVPMYHDFMRPLGCSDQLGIRLSSTSGRVVLASVARVDGLFTDDDLQLLAKLSGPLSQLYQVADGHTTLPIGLTDREAQLLRLVADGHTDRVIARRLAVSQRTVEKHLENIRAKLGVKTRTAAVALWLEGAGVNRAIAP